MANHLPVDTLGEFFLSAAVRTHGQDTRPGRAKVKELKFCNSVVLRLLMSNINERYFSLKGQSARAIWGERVLASPCTSFS